MTSLTPERWLEISPYLEHALALSAEDRAAWLLSFRVEKPQIVALLEALLESHRVAAEKGFLENHPPLPLDSTAAGQNIGPYVLLSPIGQGGMGSVWLAERNDGRFDRQVAIKFLRVSLTDSGGLERFKREGRILAQLSHPNIAELIDAGVTDKGEPYLVLEYVKGEPIDAYCDRNRLNVESRIRLFLEVTGAVAHAHASLTVHRDLKPSNVLVRDDGEVKLLDFGIAKLLQDKDGSADATALTLHGGSALTPQFAAPEQVTGAPITTATDVYGLGNLFYLLLTGCHPIAASIRSPAELIKAILEKEAVPASDAVVLSADAMSIAERSSTTIDRLARQLRGDLDTIAGKALKKNPAERYSSVSAFADDLRRYLANEPITARPDSVAYRARKFIARNKLGVTLASVAMIAVAIAVLAVQREARRAEYRFQQVQHLAHTVLFDLNPEIENLAGATPARELLVKTSLEYLDSLAAESGNDAKLQIELATAYEKIGDVQGNARFSNLGHAEAALESYGKAVAIARKLGRSPEALQLLARTYTNMGTVQAAALGVRSRARENLRLATTVADSIPALTGDPNYELRVWTYGLLGDMDEKFDPTRARAPLQHALDLAREWSHTEPTPIAKYFVSILTWERADMLWETGDLQAARKNLLESLAIIRELEAQDQHNGEWTRQEYGVDEELGTLLGDPDYFNLGDQPAAANWLEKGLEGKERLLAADPSNARASFDVSEVVADLAAVYRDSDPKRSEKLYRRSLDLSEALLKSDPSNAETLHWQALETIRFAKLLGSTGNHAEATAQLSRALKVANMLVSRDPEDLSFRDLLGIVLHETGSQLMQVGALTPASVNLQQSEQILAKVFSENPNNLMVLRDLADCHNAQGHLAAGRSNWVDARREYQKSLDLWQRWPQIGTSSIYDQRQREAVIRALRDASRHISASGTPEEQ